MMELFFVGDQYFFHLIKTDPVCTEWRRLKESGGTWNIERYKNLKNIVNCN